MRTLHNQGDVVDGVQSECVQERETTSEIMISEAGRRPALSRDRELPSCIRWREVRIRPGVWASVICVPAGRDITLGYEKGNRLLDFGFVIHGSFQHRLHDAKADMSSFDNDAGCGGVGFQPGVRGRVRFAFETGAQAVHVHVAPRALMDMVQANMDMVPAILRPILDRPDMDAAMLQRVVLTPEIRMSAAQLYRALSHDGAWSLYVESKVLELIALQLLHMAPCASCRTGAFTASEVERLHAARDWLLADDLEAPSLSDLARRVGLGVHKLQAGFREFFGTTVFGLLKEHRLQKARMLLDQADMNVSQVAWAIGYVNLSHFSAAFKKRFGVLPRDYLAGTRHRLISRKGTAAHDRLSWRGNGSGRRRR